MCNYLSYANDIWSFHFAKIETASKSSRCSHLHACSMVMIKRFLTGEMRVAILVTLIGLSFARKLIASIRQAKDCFIV